MKNVLISVSCTAAVLFAGIAAMLYLGMFKAQNSTNIPPAEEEIPLGIRLENEAVFVELSQKVDRLAAAAEKGIAVSNDRVKSLEDKVDSLNREMELQKSAISELSASKEKENEKLRPMGTLEYESLVSELHGIEKSVPKRNFGLDMESAYNFIEPGGIKELLQVFAILGAQGEDPHLCIGSVGGDGKRPVWIEKSTSAGLDILCRGLPLKGYSGLSDRKSLPETLKTPAYILRYENGALVAYETNGEYSEMAY